ncbi:hypothetical protein ACIQUM_35495 [Amycolatopsis azurea]|uniref:hypothetical protein n=1 Tax=Amycolatopsis azurea TaxID=36819 RepID=UPI0038229E5E
MTQGRSVSEARYMAADLIEILHGVSRAELEVSIDFAPQSLGPTYSDGAIKGRMTAFRGGLIGDGARPTCE